MNNQQLAVSRIMKYYKELERDDNYPWVKWVKSPKRLSRKKADALFIGILLDQGQLAERAWAGGEHFVENHFRENGNFWQNILNTDMRTIKRICQKGYDGTSYAVRYNYSRFPLWLKSAAKKIMTDYEGDVRNVWKVRRTEVNKIYDRFKEFDGIDDALAKMAQFILVREYGIAGGIKNKNKMSVKPDSHIRRVIYRCGISDTTNIKSNIEILKGLKLKSPADFDAATWLIGREFCHNTNPKCTQCPINMSCDFYNA